MVQVSAWLVWHGVVRFPAVLSLVESAGQWYGTFPLPADIPIRQSDRLGVTLADRRTGRLEVISTTSGVVHFNGLGPLQTPP